MSSESRNSLESYIQSTFRPFGYIVIRSGPPRIVPSHLTEPLLDWLLTPRAQRKLAGTYLTRRRCTSPRSLREASQAGHKDAREP
eukprot:11712481-Heterocapsa_arctica.AAC.1